MVDFYVLLEDPDANVIIALALHSALLLLVFFFESNDLRYIADQPRPLASGEDAAANMRCWSSYNSCQWSRHMSIRLIFGRCVNPPRNRPCHGLPFCQFSACYLFCNKIVHVL